MTEPKEVKKYTTLKPTMINNIGSVFDEIVPGDVDIEYFHKLKATIKEDGLLNVMDYEKLGGQFLWAKDLCMGNARVCESFQLEAKRRLENQESLAFLERAPGYLKQERFMKVNAKGEKSFDVTDGKRDKYASADKQVLDLKMVFNSWLVVTKFFLDLSDGFDKKHDWIKKLLDKEIRTNSVPTHNG